MNHAEEAIEGWRAPPRTTAGGQAWYSPLAILTALTLRAVFRLALRQAEGLIGSVIGLLGLALRVPDHSTLSRRAATLEVPRPTRPSSAGLDGESEPMAACCMDPEFRRTRPNPIRDQAMRTEIGRPSSSMRLSA